MTKENLKLEDMKYIDMYHFQMWEGKFLDTEQEGREIYIYANVSNFETETFEESEVRVYPYSYEDLYCADDYMLFIGNRDLEAYLKQTLLDNIPVQIKEANAVYTGGNIWLFYGKLDEHYFLTDDNGCTLILDADPSDLDESTFQEWQDEHLVKELTGFTRRVFCKELLDWLNDHPDNCGGMTEHEIEVYRNWFDSENY